MSDFLATVALEPCRRRNIHSALRKLQRVRTSSGLPLLAPRRPQRRGAHRRDDHCVRQGCPRAPGRTNNDRQGRHHSRSTLPSVRIHFTARVRHSCSATVPWPSTRCTRNGAPCRPLSFTFVKSTPPAPNLVVAQDRSAALRRLQRLDHEIHEPGPLRAARRRCPWPGRTHPRRQPSQQVHPSSADVHSQLQHVVNGRRQLRTRAPPHEALSRATARTLPRHKV